MILIRRINLTDLSTFVIFELLELVGRIPGNTSTPYFYSLIPTCILTKSKNHGISGTKLSVAMKSNQKKKLYLKSGRTHELTKSSIAKRKNEIMKPTKKIMSASFVVSQSLILSPNNAKTVIIVITRVTNLP